MDPFLILRRSGMEWAGGSENSSSTRHWYVVESLWIPKVSRCCCVSFSNTNPLQGRQALIQTLKAKVLVLSKRCGFFSSGLNTRTNRSFVDQLNGICSSQKVISVFRIFMFPGCKTSFACFPCIFFFSFLVWRKNTVQKKKKKKDLPFPLLQLVGYSTRLLYSDHKTAFSSVSCCWKTASKQV